jgi:hypothetical protein
MTRFSFAPSELNHLSRLSRGGACRFALRLPLATLCSHLRCAAWDAGYLVLAPAVRGLGRWLPCVRTCGARLGTLASCVRTCGARPGSAVRGCGRWLACVRTCSARLGSAVHRLRRWLLVFAPAVRRLDAGALCSHLRCSTGASGHCLDAAAFDGHQFLHVRFFALLLA